uniref:Uncharacterized protein n=1 Tax=Pyrodinium bahamense TaxID=73915 RepID=A0A7S0A9B1_9DINO
MAVPVPSSSRYGLGCWSGGGGAAATPSDPEAAALKEWGRRLENKVRSASSQPRSPSQASGSSTVGCEDHTTCPSQQCLEGMQWEHGFRLALFGMDAEHLDSRQQQHAENLEAFATQLTVFRAECAEQRRQLHRDRKALLAMRDDTAKLWKEVMAAAALMAGSGGGSAGGRSWAALTASAD